LGRRFVVPRPRRAPPRARGPRAIGVVYRPRYEHYGNYVPAVLPLRYDALLFIEATHGVAPLHFIERKHGEAAETFPTGM